MATMTLTLKDDEFTQDAFEVILAGVDEKGLCRRVFDAVQTHPSTPLRGCDWDVQESAGNVTIRFSILIDRHDVDCLVDVLHQQNVRIDFKPTERYHSLSGTYS